MDSIEFMLMATKRILITCIVLIIITASVGIMNANKGKSELQKMLDRNTVKEKARMDMIMRR